MIKWGPDEELQAIRDFVKSMNAFHDLPDEFEIVFTENHSIVLPPDAKIELQRYVHPLSGGLYCEIELARYIEPPQGTHYIAIHMDHDGYFAYIFTRCLHKEKK